MKPNIYFGIQNIVTALLLIAISIPLAKRKIKMNSLYGVRTKKSFESDANWYDINAYGGRQLIIWTIPMILAGIACFFVPISHANKDSMAFVMGLAPTVVCVTIAVIRILRYANKL